jgi:subtilisin family serine protease
MQLTVRKYVNVRVGKPSVNAPTYQYLAPGSILTVIDNEFNGDDYNGLNKWYRDAADNYYWKGAFLDPATFDPNLTNTWFDKLRIREVWDIEKGGNSNVLILDTGINMVPGVFADLKADVYRSSPSFTTTKSIDPNCHGTHCAALIASREFAPYPVGVAPEAGLYIAKVSESGQLKDSATLKSALSEFLKPGYDGKIDIISISQSVVKNDPELEALISQHIQKKRIVVASIGNDIEMKNSPFARFPASFDNVISVGACNLDGTLARYTLNPSKAKIFCYGTDVKSYKSIAELAPLTGTSQATAIVAGVCALIVSLMKRKNMDYDLTTILNLLRQGSVSMPGAGYPVVQPFEILKHLKQL